MRVITAHVRRPHDAPTPLSADALAALLASCVEEGVLTEEQAHAVRSRADVSTPVAPVGPAGGGRPALAASTGSLVLEAFGYVGGVIVMVGAGLLVGQAWSGWSPTTRLVLVTATALILLVVGASLPGVSGVTSRLRHVLLLASTLAATGAASLAADRILATPDRWIAPVTAGVGAVYAAALWTWWRSLTQQLATMILVAVAVGSTVDTLVDRQGWPGVAVMVVGLAWAIAGHLRLLEPRVVVRGAGAVMMVVGGMIAAEPDWGLVLALVVVAGILAAGVALTDLVLLGVGAVGLLQVLPGAVDRWFPGSSAAALVLLVAGLAMVGLVLWVARRRARQRGRQPSVGAGTPEA